jgi:uncharacterized protein (TIGR02444 family)
MKSASKQNLRLEGAHWSFAIGLYEQPEVAKACVLLQDRLGADVCLLLFVLFLAQKHRIILKQPDLGSLDDVIANWRREVISPLRSLRRRLKTGPNPAPDSATNTLLKTIKRAEIDAEQIELATLAQWFDMSPRASSRSSVDIAVVLDSLAVFFATRSSDHRVATSPDVRAALKTITDAMALPC